MAIFKRLKGKIAASLTKINSPTENVTIVNA